MVEGQVKQLSQNHHGDVHGFILKDGTEVRFPPHEGEKVSRLVKKGSAVQVVGKEETRPDGSEVFRASSIEVDGHSIALTWPPKKKKGKEKAKGKGKAGGKGRGAHPMHASSTVYEFDSNPHGEIDGFILHDETVVKVPKHQGAELQELFKIGDEVEVHGRRHETRHGDVHLHAERIVATASGKVFTRDGGPGSGSQVSQAALAEILSELKELRKAIEGLGVQPKKK